ncbi:MAG: hypothetical protein MJ252_01590 [archaeon]|nr:hypothetical protein [archaeon]
MGFVPNPQSPIPNPQSPIYDFNINKKIYIIKNILFIKNIFTYISEYNIKTYKYRIA